MGINTRKVVMSLVLASMISTPSFASTLNQTSFLPTKVEEANKRIDYNSYTYSEMYTTDNVNLRTEPSAESLSVNILPPKTMVFASEYNDAWSIVKISEVDFYFISTQYLSDICRSYSDNDLWWLAHLIGGEMMDESWEDQVYTGSVCLNRVNSNKWPGHSLEETITQKKWGIQYACYWDGNFQREPTKTNWEVAKYLLENGSQIPQNVVYQSQFKQGKIWKHTSAAYYCYGEY